MNTETGEAEVQSGKFKIGESNTFLVLHAGEPSVPRNIISLGVLVLPSSKDQPASVLLLKANPELMGRINKEAAAGDR
jgi:hypothetical protein